jgi:hypothetical protein
MRGVDSRDCAHDKLEGWMVEECEAAAGRRLDRSLRQVRERAG